MFSKKIVNMSPARILLLIFFVFIIFGAMLLKLPFATTDRITWLNALFTSTSAMTVTGLVVVDTGQAFTLFGKIVIMFLIQIGGLGIMTFAVLIFILLGKKIGLKERILLQQSLNQTNLGGVVQLVKKLFYFSFIIEASAALFLFLRWAPLMGWKQALFAAVFHAVSAFNNAGFSIWSDNLTAFVGDPVVNLVITGLIILGGIGFTVMIDLWNKRSFSKLTVHSKLMLIGTLITNVLAITCIFLLEYSNAQTLGSLSLADKFWASYFQGIVPRTAGFNSIDIAGLGEATIFIMIILMFIGAGSASTGGGIKLTTFLAMFLTVFAFLKGKSEIVVFRRTISEKIIIRSLTIAMISISVVILAALILVITEDASFMTILFEVVSAFGTVGLSMNFTGELTWIGKIVIIFVMFVGKIGPLTLAFSFAKPDKSLYHYPKEDILTG
ncbi:Ktr system potassium transporter B [Bacillaceae bacterium Marseille-Q3522]|nr:Ktr system potassium transporter B [Bacillaceae bacterium Marseille-Q3522]